MEQVIAPTPWGELYVFKGDHIGNSIIEHGAYEKDLINIILSNVLKKNINAIDIGANVGSHTIAYARNFQTVTAFEPQTIVRDLLKQSVVHNRLDNVVVSDAAVGHIDGTTYIKELEESTNFGGCGISQTGNEKTMVKLDSTPWDNLGLIKIDVEGAESLIFYGARETIEKHRPVIFWENNKIVEFMDKYYMFDRELREFNPLSFLMCDLRYYRIEKLGKNLIALP